MNCHKARRHQSKTVSACAVRGLKGLPRIFANTLYSVKSRLIGPTSNKLDADLATEPPSHAALLPHRRFAVDMKKKPFRNFLIVYEEPRAAIREIGDGAFPRDRGCSHFRLNTRNAVERKSLMLTPFAKHVWIP
jgi:hypothetical protein